MNKFLILFFLMTAGFASIVKAEMGIPVQIKLKAPDGSYPNQSGVNFNLQILSPSSSCILREESFSNQTIVNGSISLVLGAGTRGSHDPALTLNQVYDNSTSKSGLSCVDANDSVVSTGQTYTPAGSADVRVVRITTMIGSDNILVDFAMRSVPNAVQAESVGGKAGSDILIQNTSSQLNQTNLNDLLLDSTRFSNLKNFAISGSAATATTATNFSGSLAGDVTGTQGATSVGRIKGVPVSATSPTPGQVLVFNGSQYAPTTVTSPVTSVAGRTGVVTLSTSDISGLGTAATLNAGTAANNVVQLDGSGKIPSSTLPANVLTGSAALAGDVSGTLSATTVLSIGGKTSSEVASAVTDVAAANSSNTVGTIVKRDASGNFSGGIISSASDVTNNLYLFDTTNAIRLKAPSGLGANLVFTLPNSAGSVGQVLQTDGAGNMSWVNPASGSVNSVTAAAPLTSSGGSNPNISITQANTSTDGYLKSSDWNSFNNKQNALGFTPLNPSNNLSDLASVASARSNLGLGNSSILNVGTAAGTVAAGDDSRITGALQSSSYNADVAPAASCTSSQTPYWNTVTDTWACQNISFPVAASLSGDVTGAISSNTVNSVGGKTSAEITSAVNDVQAATYANSSDAIVKRDINGNIELNSVFLNNATNAVNIKVAAGLSSDLTLILPTSNGSSGQVLRTDGAGNLSWVNQAAAGVGSVTASAPLSSSGGAAPNISLSQANTSTSGYLSSTDWNTFNNKQNALGFNPLNPANNLSDVASTSTARTNLGLGSAATQNVGTSAGNVVQLDASAKIPTSTLPTFVSSVAASAPLSSSGGTTPSITIAKATTSVDGYLSSIDWN
ncbi:MAG: beta strand repeat-containing protein, partial [Pseudobdellovibrio sp.]